MFLEVLLFMRLTTSRSCVCLVLFNLFEVLMSGGVGVLMFVLNL